MKYNRPIVLSIAGFDPTGGAGVLSDVKTFEQHGCLGMAVLTGNTIQTETDFISIDWFNKEAIMNQLQPILSNYTISAVKIGIVENLDVLNDLLMLVKSTFPDSQIVWDPVLSASSGFVLHASWNEESLSRILTKVDLITPNALEVKRITGIEDEIEAAFKLAQFTNVLLKGGHSSLRLGLDLLFEESVPRDIPAKLDPKLCFSKHGSGCILSSAIASNLALGKPLFEACHEAKYYIEKRLSSNENLLAYHV